MSKFKKLTFLKVLTTVAWADGEVTHSELNILKSFYRKFDLEKNELDELKPYLHAPISNKEKDLLYRQMIAELSTPAEKKEIMNALENMMQVHKRMKGEERQLVEQFSEWLEKSSFTKRSFGRFRNFFQKTIFEHARDPNPDMEKYFKRRVLKKIELKTSNSGVISKLPEDKLYFLCLVGTLMASIAHVDNHLDPEEKKALKVCLSEQFSLKGKELALLFEVVEEQGRKDFDFHEVISEINQLTSYNDRLHFMECLFAVAAADGEISHDEAEEIRKVTKAMRISHDIFIKAKVRAKKAIK